jgi:hypothetical protein
MYLWFYGLPDLRVGYVLLCGLSACRGRPAGEAGTMRTTSRQQQQQHGEWPHMYCHISAAADDKTCVST